LRSEYKIHALIVDDEIHARDELAALVQETGEINITGKCANALEALHVIKIAPPDVVFLDIQMPVVNGFEMLNMIDEEDMPLVVFVTAYDEYAIKAFEENALDYLLKPIEKDRLSKTVLRLKKNLERGRRQQGVFGSQGDKGRFYPFSEITRIPCLLSNRVKLIETSAVEFIRSHMAGVYVICPSGEFYTELTLKVLETRTNLVRCHRQFLVNLDCVDEIILHNNLLAQMRTKSGKSVPVSRRYLKKLKDKLGI
jgi:two-component system LytT family response regulator